MAYNPLDTNSISDDNWNLMFLPQFLIIAAEMDLFIRILSYTLWLSFVLKFVLKATSSLVSDKSSNNKR